MHGVRRERRALCAGAARISTSNELFDEVLGRARSDVYTVTTATPLGPYPYAGIPWFSTMFGRDGIITALLFAWMDPSLARGVLENLAALQATGFNRAADAEPGKIMHEIRHGEMANAGEVPFRRYYGSVDATPLFVMLAGQYFERTGDRETIGRLWPNVEAALSWIDTYGDRDGDGFVEYQRETESGLANQGWKDSHDAVFHADGTMASGPIALCEVQAYVFAAKRSAATLAEALGMPAEARRFRDEAEEIRVRFERAFWCEELGTYALALDGDKHPCRVRTSNAGHALFAGIAAPERAARVSEGLMRPSAFSGWGIRTLASTEARYNPVSYHNGSVWPHDNAIIAMGFTRYGFMDAAQRILGALFGAATHQDAMRLPELFCGFQRKPYRGPTAYPVACAPQAWAAASVFGALGACLGLQLRHPENEILFEDPTMPDFLQAITLENLTLGDSRACVELRRYMSDVAVHVRDRQGSARVLVTK
nr:amylo-alpha-1,6-glucosidase [Chthonobacter rhizosphaerae]